MQTLQTKRTILRTLTPADAADFFWLNADDDVLRYTGDKSFGSVEEARNFLSVYVQQYERNGTGRLAVIDKQSNVFMGWCGLKYSADLNEYDIGFRFHKKFWNKGFATEAAIACLEYGFMQLNLKEVIGRSLVNNIASIKVLEKLGLTLINQQDFHGAAG